MMSEKIIKALSEFIVIVCEEYNVENNQIHTFKCDFITGDSDIKVTSITLKLKIEDKE